MPEQDAQFNLPIQMMSAGHSVVFHMVGGERCGKAAQCTYKPVFVFLLVVYVPERDAGMPAPLPCARRARIVGPDFRRPATGNSQSRPAKWAAALHKSRPQVEIAAYRPKARGRHACVPA
jgi:hypothetical protein